MVVGKGRKSSYHITVFLNSRQRNWGKKPIRIFNIWFEDEKFVALVIRKWRDLEFLDLSIHSKFRALRETLRQWDNSKGNCGLRIKQLENLLFDHDVNHSQSSNKSEIEKELNKLYLTWDEC